MAGETSDSLLQQLLNQLDEQPELLEQLRQRLTSAPPKAQNEGNHQRVAGAVQPAPPTRSSQPQRILDRSIISTALIDWIKQQKSSQDWDENTVFPVIIEVSLEHNPEVKKTHQKLVTKIKRRLKLDLSAQDQYDMPEYVFARLTEAQIEQIAALDDQLLSQLKGKDISPNDVKAARLISRIWPDFPIEANLHQTRATVKAEAAFATFAAAGKDIVWAVMDSGIQSDHPHFERHKNLELKKPLRHHNLLGDDADALVDRNGHGTHVAGIIGGEWRPEQPGGDKRYQQPFRACVAFREGKEGEDVVYRKLDLSTISGIAPRCKLISYKVLNDAGKGEVSNLMKALRDVHRLNAYGRDIRIHGVNISIGYPFNPEWFACGQSPICVEVNRLVSSGVLVVVAAGNTGFGTLASSSGNFDSALGASINDPGNAQDAITVGSAHRDKPHLYGVSYFSSKGPTGDGRRKPDLVAPGERILSCAAGRKLAEMQAKGQEADYIEDSGTSMAAPHVSGAAAAFLSVQKEFIGRPLEVKRIFMETATDLGRTPDYQGAGLIDLMRALQSV